MLAEAPVAPGLAAAVGPHRPGRAAEPNEGEMAALDGDVLVRYEAVYGRREISPGTRRLLLAVLEEGVRTLRANARGTGARAMRLRREAMRWLLGRQPASVFGFASICDALDLDATRLRGRILDTIDAR
ncbi:MAG TPA: hypothetical protein VKW76_04005 [Candidatus Binatia bacterium]|nr:hypothetical protein [Candidatus Binatia bacterium]